MFKVKKFLAVSVLTGVLVSSIGFNAYAYADDDEGGLDTALKVAGGVELAQTAIRAINSPEARERSAQAAETGARIMESTPMYRIMPEPVREAMTGIKSVEFAIGGRLIGAVESIIRDVTQQ